MASRIYVDRQYFKAEISLCNSEKDIKVQLLFTDHKPYNLLRQDAYELYSELHDDLVVHCRTSDLINLFIKDIIACPEEIIYKAESNEEKEKFVEIYYFDKHDFAVHPGTLESTLILGDLVRFQQITEQTLMYVEILQDIRSHLSKLTIDEF